MKLSTKILTVAFVVAIALTVTTVASAATFERNLTIGSTGSDVMALQQVLNSNPATVVAVTGVGSAGMESSYFGGLTKAAVIKYQIAKGITPAVGYVGPITRAALNAGGAVVPPIGALCPNGNTLASNCATPPGTTPPVVTLCPNGMTLASNCTTAPGGTTPPVTGGAGSLSGYALISSITNEKVGEGANDIKVYGLEAKADNTTDIELMAIKLVFNEGTAGSDFNKYADTVKVMLGTKVLATLDADEFKDETGTANDWTKTVSLASGGIIKAGEKGQIYVTVSGISNLDSADAGDTWTIDPSSLRYRDGQGTVISEDPGTAARTFTFNTFATASDLEMKTSLSANSPIEGSVVVDSNDDTITLLKFKIKAVGSDITIKEVPVVITATSTNIADLVDSAKLSWAGGEQSIDLDDADWAETPNFDDINLVIEDGDTVEFTVTANSATSSVASATTTLQATVTPDDIVAKDQSGETIADADSTGSAVGETQHLYTIGADVVVGARTITRAAANNDDLDSADASITVTVTAKGGTIYLNGDDETTAANEFAVVARDGGSAASTTVAYEHVIIGGTYTTTNSAADNEYYAVNDGDSITIQVKGTVSQAATSSNVLAGMLISAIQFGTDSTSDTTRSANVMNWSDLTDLLKTGKVSLSNAD